jgi:hypothetical protein
MERTRRKALLDELHIGERFQVKASIWSRIEAWVAEWTDSLDEPYPMGFVMCVNCVEQHMSRDLWPEDFEDVPLNFLTHGPKSPRLIHRLGGSVSSEEATAWEHDLYTNPYNFLR